jgi:hypothetical protein
MTTYDIVFYESYLSTVQRLAGGFIPLLGSHLVHSSQHNEVNTPENPSFKGLGQQMDIFLNLNN